MIGSLHISDDTRAPVEYIKEHQHLTDYFLELGSMETWKTIRLEIKMRSFTILQLFHILDKWTRALDIVFSDFMKAFDKVLRKRLIS